MSQAYHDGRHLCDMVGVDQAVAEATSDWLEMALNVTGNPSAYDLTSDLHRYAIMCYCIGRQDGASIVQARDYPTP
jgi:hypothetical protein